MIPFDDFNVAFRMTEDVCIRLTPFLRRDTVHSRMAEDGWKYNSLVEITTEIYPDSKVQSDRGGF